MPTDQSDSTTKDELNPRRRGRKPYEKPRIIFSEPLETFAAACVPMPPGKGNAIDCGVPQS